MGTHLTMPFPAIEGLSDKEAGAAVHQWAVEQTALAFQTLSRPGLHIPEEDRRRVAALAESGDLGEARELVSHIASDAGQQN